MTEPKVARAFLLQLLIAVSVFALASCGSDGSAPTAQNPAVAPATTPLAPPPPPAPPPAPKPVVSVTQTAVATLDSPWSMAFLPDGNMLITERPPTPKTVANPIEPGRLRSVTQAGVVSAPITGLSANVGLLDVKLDPNYAINRLVYISFMERDPSAPRVGRNAGDTNVDPAGLAVMRGALSADGTSVTGVTVIWRQFPKIVSNPGSGEPGGKMAFSPDGKYLFVTSGDRQETSPALIQDIGYTIGKIIRIFPDGGIPNDNPFIGRPALGEIWSIGHRNPYGLAFNAAGELWENEMGPQGGDELNMIVTGKNYGWPNVSYGDNYGGAPMVKPSAGDGYELSAFWWTPVIAPSGLIFYSGDVFGDWKGDAIISGLVSKGLVRVRISGTTATELQRIDLGQRIRAVAQGPDGALWVLEDAVDGRLLKLGPVF